MYEYFNFSHLFLHKSYRQWQVKTTKNINKFQFRVKCIENHSDLKVQSVGKQSGNYIIIYPNSPYTSVDDWIFPCNHYFLLDDFMLLLCASLQRQTFEDENKAAVRIMAGDNVEICMNLDAASFSQHNPVPDFIHCR